ncbi:MAG: DUF2753 family protein [Aestuariibacter sp.]
MNGSASLYEQWRRFILRGNQCFEDGLYLIAISHYESAKALSLEMIEAQDELHKAVASLLVCHHNLCDLYLVEKEAELACSELSCVHDKLTGYLQVSDGQPDYCEVIRQGLRCNYRTMTAFMKRYGNQKWTADKLLVPNIANATPQFVN